MTSSRSADAKDALARLDVAELHCRLALRDGLARYGRDERTGAFRSQRLTVARLARSLMEVGGERPIRKVPSTRLQRVPAFVIDDFPSAPDRKPTLRCDRRMELRAAFLVCGSLASPARGYHLEFVPPNDAAHARLVTLLRAEGLTPKLAVRKAKRIVYFKDVDAITDALAVIGAAQAVFALEDVRALKETKNRIHRLVNTEAANVDRAMRAAVAQREAIAFLADAYGFGHLRPALREVAELRLAHPTETLAEIGRRCRPPANKSTTNNRITTLVRLAQAARKGGDAPS